MYKLSNYKYVLVLRFVSKLKHGLAFNNKPYFACREECYTDIMISDPATCMCRR